MKNLPPRVENDVQDGHQNIGNVDAHLQSQEYDEIDEQLIVLDITLEASLEVPFRRSTKNRHPFKNRELCKSHGK